MTDTQAVATRRIKCRHCSWTTPLWSGRRSGWARLVDHVIDAHPEIKVRAELAVFGTTAAGLESVRKASRP